MDLILLITLDIEWDLHVSHCSLQYCSKVSWQSLASQSLRLENFRVSSQLSSRETNELVAWLISREINWKKGLHSKALYMYIPFRSKHVGKSTCCDTWKNMTQKRAFPRFFEGLKMAEVGYKWKSTVTPVVIEWQTASFQFSFQNLRKFCSLRHAVAEWNLIQLNNFGCLAGDRNLPCVVSKAVPLYIQRRFLSRFYNVGRGFKLC